MGRAFFLVPTPFNCELLRVSSSSTSVTDMTTQNHRDAIETVEQAIAESERLTGRPLAELLVDPLTGEIRPIALVTDNGPCFKSVRFTAYIDRRPE